ncbi:hypothetical protein ONS95_015014 [Cadophora gregata]|uniref:uncharacterized protein n=1 Tax=Cadophora gregata TaxID=51156 RepID=UPI0026DD4DA8|nr:uncharacterized protein ONS95_015014 [Cadophora gregata]KAK0128663.1 hypothetical protein ONS95_015014 [Cadophora gregata]
MRAVTFPQLRLQDTAEQRMSLCGLHLACLPLFHAYLPSSLEMKCGIHTLSHITHLSVHRNTCAAHLHHREQAECCSSTRRACERLEKQQLDRLGSSETLGMGCYIFFGDLIRQWVIRVL